MGLSADTQLWSQKKEADSAKKLRQKSSPARLRVQRGVWMLWRTGSQKI